MAAKYAYYPGCSLHSTGSEYDVSFRAVCDKLGIAIEEIKGWVCCGTSPAPHAPAGQQQSGCRQKGRCWLRHSRLGGGGNVFGFPSTEVLEVDESIAVEVAHRA